MSEERKQSIASASQLGLSTLQEPPRANPLSESPKLGDDAARRPSDTWEVHVAQLEANEALQDDDPAPGLAPIEEVASPVPTSITSPPMLATADASDSDDDADSEIDGQGRDRPAHGGTIARSLRSQLSNKSLASQAEPTKASPSASTSKLPIEAIAPSPASQEPAPMSIFIQLGRETKKAVLEPDQLPPDVASLRVLFTDKFAYNPGLEDFPSIYIRDPASGVEYELEDMSEVRPGVLLSLNIEGELDLAIVRI